MTGFRLKEGIETDRRTGLVLLSCGDVAIFFFVAFLVWPLFEIFRIVFRFDVLFLLDDLFSLRCCLRFFSILRWRLG